MATQTPVTTYVRDDGEEEEAALPAWIFERGSAPTIPSASHQFGKSSQGFLSLVHGFTTTPTQKQPGGTCNTVCLAPQVLHVQFAYFPAASLKICVELCTKRGEFIAHLSSQLVYSSNGTSAHVTFDSLIVRHSSHHYSKGLVLVFKLYNVHSGECVDSLSSATFATITTRGVQKQQKKRIQGAKPKQKIFVFKEHKFVNK